jgi:ribosomal-protein-alanine N-acetyltransferase
MHAELFTSRLHLKALSSKQLELLLHNRTLLESELEIPVADALIDDVVARAINMKLEKLAGMRDRFPEWITYWLIVIKADSIGAGLIGFKGYPDTEGKTEIGYGIHSSYRNQGYMTEAVRALCTWAFANLDCKTLTAKGVVNPASERVLKNSGWHRVRDGDSSSDWELSK